MTTGPTGILSNVTSVLLGIAGISALIAVLYALIRYFANRRVGEDTSVFRTRAFHVIGYILVISLVAGGGFQAAQSFANQASSAVANDASKYSGSTSSGNDPTEFLPSKKSGTSYGQHLDEAMKNLADKNKQQIANIGNSAAGAAQSGASMVTGMATGNMQQAAQGAMSFLQNFASGKKSLNNIVDIGTGEGSILKSLAIDDSVVDSWNFIQKGGFLGAHLDQITTVFGSDGTYHQEGGAIQSSIKSVIKDMKKGD